MLTKRAERLSQKKTAATGVGARNGGKAWDERDGKHAQPGTCRTAPRLTTLSLIWSDDRRHLQGWEVRAC